MNLKDRLFIVDANGLVLNVPRQKPPTPLTPIIYYKDEEGKVRYMLLLPSTPLEASKAHARTLALLTHERVVLELEDEMGNVRKIFTFRPSKEVVEREER